MKDYEKYYLPSIEEFHVGFEFEVLMYYKNDPVWIDRTFCNTDSIQSIEMSHSKDSFRVKRLDRDDVESLGWEANESSQYYKGKLRIDINPNIPTLVVIKDSYTYNRKEVAYVGYNTLFDGTINNKSELKRILKQLGI